MASTSSPGSTPGKGRPTPKQGSGKAKGADEQHTVFRLRKDWADYSPAEKEVALEKIAREVYD